MRGPAVQTCRSRPIIAAAQIEPELGGDDHVLAEGSEGFANKLFVQERAVDLGSIEERDAAFTAARRSAIISCLSFGGPYEKLIPIQPRPRAETSRPLLPNLRFCICLSSQLQARAIPRARGIPILPILFDTSLAFFA